MRAPVHFLVLGRVLAQWDRITTPHLAAELLTGATGSELWLRVGRLHVYLTLGGADAGGLTPLSNFRSETGRGRGSVV